MIVPLILLLMLIREPLSISICVVHFAWFVSVSLLEASSVLGADNRKLFKNL